MDRLKLRRTSIKSSITRIYNYCSDANATNTEIAVRIEKLESYFREFEELQSELEANCASEEEIAAEQQHRIHVEGRYYATKSIYQNRLTQDGNANAHVPDTSNQQLVAAVENIARNQSTLGELISRLSTNDSTSVPSPNHQQAPQRETIKLPRIQLPEFDGTTINWIRFRDLFEATVHNNQSLANIEKFEYLQCHLRGDALSIIKHLSPSNDNYEVGWQLIKGKFDDFELIKKGYLKLLFDQPSMKGPFANELNRLINNTNESVNALKTLNEQVDQWGSVLLFHIERKLDSESRALWYRSASNSPTFKNFLEFLNQRLRELENNPENKTLFKQPVTKQKVTSNIHTSTVKTCPVCSERHLLFACDKFKALDVNERIKIVRNNNICFNCLQCDHVAADCTRSNCKKCNKKHNTLLHREANYGNSLQRSITTNSSEQQIGINIVHTNHQQTITLLPTAVVKIKDQNNIFQTCRILLDTGAQVSLIDEACVQRLNLRRIHDNTVLCGIGEGKVNNARGKVQIVLKSNTLDHTLSTTALCLSKLTQQQPSVQVSSTKLKYFNNLILADKCNIPSHIDIILGADTFNEWFLNEQIVHPSGSPAALSTILGWTIIGKVTGEQISHITIAHASIDFNEQLYKFWDIEELKENKQYLTEEEERAELHYQQTVSRDEDGRYMVRLPFKKPDCEFGNTVTQALKRFQSMENKFKNNTQLHHDYTKFMDEYRDLQHMELAKQSETASYHLPHHAVIKPHNTTTKLRVVFDGSAKGTNGISLNDQLLIGPTIQNDLFNILMQFRKEKIGLCGDIEKMYRQVLIHPDDRKYQAILWRDDNKKPISTFYLSTVTYGTSAAPFLAVRTLKQVAIDNHNTNPEISDIIQKCFYVDDLMYCAPDVKTAIDIKTQLCDILRKSGFNLRKWSSNSIEVLQTIDENDREATAKTNIDDTPTVKTLGVYWDTNDDVFRYKLTIPEIQPVITKRIALSIISKIFDPLGWASPVVVTMKIFMQRIWLRGLDWDVPLPDDLLCQWTQFHNNINAISNLQIPRWLHYANNTHVELHGFADSSELAYAAVVYLKVTHANGMTTTRLVATKTKVAPVKQITLPRLELCAAQLTVKLLLKIKTALNIPNCECFGWTDSMIVLAWLSDHPRKWKNFVANRTSYIINILPVQFWNHIKSSQNPADVATRGSSPSELANNQLWWYGPSILKSQKYKIPGKNEIECTELEKRTNTILHVIETKNYDLFEMYSDFSKLNRITAFVQRFINNCRPGQYTKKTGSLTVNELKYAHDVLVKKAQQQSFQSEIKQLSSGKQLPQNHKLSGLTPFLDNNNLLRVGGRLENANIPYNQKHPLILHKNNLFTELLVRHYHLCFLHAGVRQMQYILGRKYWIPSVTYIIKRCVYKCTTCIRFRNKVCQQLMGDLPKQRVEMALPFQNCGVDFAGPLMIKSWKGRGSKQYKCWIALFVCLVTKAIHIELVTELTTDAFIVSLRRFIARRGKPNNIFSDNGTNFIGCNRRLLELIQFLNKSKTKEIIANETASQEIQWHFSPPSGSHFGGIWEAGVKSIKNHLYRVLGTASVTYEEMTTILCQIENCLNSRPLSLKFEGDEDPLTPGHFLIMRGMQTIPDEDSLKTKFNRLSKWQQLQKLVQSFWNKWSTEYLLQMQTRPKWKNKSENLKKNDVVIVINDQLPPTKWSIGRIVDTHPGHDGLVRVATVKTQLGQYKRPITKLCPLLVDP